MGLIILIILVLLLIGALPTWPYSAGWGYHPASAILLLLLIVIVLALLGQITLFTPAGPVIPPPSP